MEKAVKLSHEIAKMQLEHHWKHFMLAKVLVNGVKLSPNQ